MIGLGLGRSRQEEMPGSDIGMLDVSANALAVLILATMLVITVAAPPALRGERQTDERPKLFYPSPLDVVVAPQTTYWTVTGAGLTRLSIDDLVVDLAAGNTIARTDEMEVTLIVGRNGYRDLNDHRLQVSLDWDAVRQGAVPVTGDANRVAATEMIRTAFENQSIAPTFIVLAEGAEAFAGLYWQLRDEQIPMRWTAISAGAPLVLSRRVSNFETRASQWQ